MGRKNRIGVIGAKGFPGYGGAARANERIFVRLVDRFEITVYALETHAGDENYYGIRQIIFKRYFKKRISDLAYYFKSALHAILLEKYDLIHLNHHIAGFLVPLLRVKYRVIFNIRGLPYDKDDKWTRLEKKLIGSFYKIGSRFADQVVTVEKSSVKKLSQYSRSKVVYIPNGVEDNYKKINRESIAFLYDISFAAARIIYLKGLHTLFDALNMICFSGNIQVIGDLEQVVSYRAKIENLSNNLNVDFKGLLIDRGFLFQCIAQSKLFVFPSFTEGMSNMLLEVASLKVPIIASDIEQNRDIFDEREVLFFKVGSASDLASKIKWSLVNFDQMVDMASNAYQRVLAEHSWDRISERYKELYESLL